MEHDHSHHEINEKRLFWSILLNLLITVAEITGGILSNSLALISDALHNLTDTVAVGVAWVANKISKRESNERKTFGYKRIEIIAAFFNSGVMVAISVYLFVEAIKRFSHPEPIKGQLMFWVAAIGLVANLLALLLLKNDAHKNLNIRAAFLHLMGDTLSSVVVILGGVVIIVWEIYWVDPLITILISVYLMIASWKIFKESLDILMQGTPKNMDVEEIAKQIKTRVDQVCNIHHVHLWSLNDSQLHFECHAELNDNIRISETEGIRKEIEMILLEDYGIRHITIQVEYQACEGDSVIHH